MNKGDHVYGVAVLVDGREGALSDVLEVWTDRAKAKARVEAYNRAYPERRHLLATFWLDTPHPGSPGSGEARDEQAIIEDILRHAVAAGATDASERIAVAMWAAEMLQHLAEPVALIGRGKPITVTEYKELDPGMRAEIASKGLAPGRDGVTILLVNPEGEVTLGKPMIFMVTRLTRDRVAALEKLNLCGPKVVQ